MRPTSLLPVLTICLLFLGITQPANGATPPDRPLTPFPSPTVPSDTSVSDSPPGDEPVLIVPGWASGPEDLYYWPLDDYLVEAGYSPESVHGVRFAESSWLAVDSPREHAQILADKIRQLHDRTGRKVDLIAHSMGGLAARWYVEQMDGSRYVDDLVTMGTPHRGNNVAYLFSFTAGASATTPGSRFLGKLEPLEFTEDVNYVNLWSMMDFFYVNRWNAKIPDRIVESHSNVHQERYSFLPHLLMPYVTFDEYVDHLD